MFNSLGQITTGLPHPQVSHLQIYGCRTHLPGRDLSICRGPGTNIPQILREDYSTVLQWIIYNMICGVKKKVYEKALE